MDSHLIILITHHNVQNVLKIPEKVSDTYMNKMSFATVAACSVLINAVHLTYRQYNVRNCLVI